MVGEKREKDVSLSFRKNHVRERRTGCKCVLGWSVWIKSSAKRSLGISRVGDAKIR